MRLSNSIALLLFSAWASGVWIAVAANEMPKPAPQRESAPASAAPDRAEFVVKTRTASAEPLSGQVSKLGADGAAIRGGVENFIRTDPKLSDSLPRSVPAEAFRLWLEETHRQFAVNAGRIAEGQVVVVKGTWDDSAKTLRKFGIPYERVKSGDLEDMPLDAVKVLIVDCAGKVPRSACQRIRDFVARGGYLLSTDWALDNCVSRTFPGYVEWDRKTNARPLYDAEIQNPDPVLFNRVVSNSFWKMDEASHLIGVLKPNAVRVLARSKGLLSEDAVGQGVLAVEFPFGRGYVLHMVGHFDNNAILPSTLPDPSPVIGISMRQAIAANFVVAGLSGQRIP
jgi:hypothetical protein